MSAKSRTWAVGCKDKTFAQVLLVPKVPTCFFTSNLPQCLKIFWMCTDKPSILTALMSSISRPSPISIQKPTLTPLQFHVFSPNTPTQSGFLSNAMVFTACFQKAARRGGFCPCLCTVLTAGLDHRRGPALNPHHCLRGFQTMTTTERRLWKNRFYAWVVSHL